MDNIHVNNSKLFTEKMICKIKIVVYEKPNSFAFNNLENESYDLYSNIIPTASIITSKAIKINNSYPYKNTPYLLPDILLDDLKIQIMTYLDYRLDLFTIQKIVLHYHNKAFNNYRKNCLSDMTFYRDHNWIQYNNNNNYYNNSFKVEEQEINYIIKMNNNPYLKSIRKKN